MIRWIILGVLFYLALLVAKLPAQFVLAQVELPKEIQVFGVDGTIWNGTASSASWKGNTLEKISWQLSPTALLTGKAELALKAGDRRSAIQLNGIVGASSEGAYAQELLYEFPASLVKEFNRSLPANLSGQFKGIIVEASQGEPWCETLRGRVNWLEPEINGRAMGQKFDLKLDQTQAKLSCDKGNLVADITDEGKVLGLSVNASLSAKDYVISGEMKPGSEFPQEFKQGLGFFASPMSGGRYKIEMNGSL